MIKYRVYDTQEKKYRDDLYFFIAPNGELLWSYELTDGLYPTDPQRFIIEQYTGLEDKNGVEIAVGDILMDDTGEFVEYWSVSFSDGSFIGGCAGVSESLSELTDLEVISSIHENADLLEVNNG